MKRLLTALALTASLGAGARAQTVDGLLSRYGCESEHRAHEVTVTCDEPRIEEMLPEIREKIPALKSIPDFLLALAGGTDVIVGGFLQVAAGSGVRRAFEQGDIGPVHVTGLVIFIDAYGKSAERKEFEFSMDKGTYDRIDWSHFDPTDLPKVAQQWHAEPQNKDVPIGTVTGTISGTMTVEPTPVITGAPEPPARAVRPMLASSDTEQFKDLVLDSKNLAEENRYISVVGVYDGIGEVLYPPKHTMMSVTDNTIELSTDDSPREVREFLYGCRERFSAGLASGRDNSCRVRVTGHMQDCFLNPCLAVEQIQFAK